MRAKALIATLLALLILGGGYAGWWFYTAGLLRTEIEVWIADQRTKGAEIGYRALDIGGFPFWTTVTVRDGTAAFPNGIGWRGPELEARTRPWNWTAILFEVRGLHRMTVPAAEGSPPLSMSALAGSGELSLTYGGQPTGARGALHQLSVGTGPDVTPASGLTVGVVEFAATRPIAPPRDYREPGLTVSGSAQQIRLPEEVKAPLGKVLERLSVAGSVMGQLPVPVGRESLAAWRDAGGIVELRNLGLAWGAVAAEAGGTLALDRQLQPQGALTGKIVGFVQAIDAMVATGQLRPNAANLAKAAMGLLARKETPDGPPVLTTPITIQDRTLFLGPVKLVQMPMIDWP
jgi:hypothetical protein